MTSESDFRLPRSVVPDRYDLVLEPDLDTLTFWGRVEIAVDVTRPTREILLNALELEIEGAHVEHSDGRRIEAVVTIDKDAERAHLALARSLEAGPWTVHLSFRGELTDQLRGFYRSTWTDEEGAEHTLACTQFESSDARRAFPCWDEPDLKAVFGVTLVVAEGLLAISNAAEAERRPTGDGRIRIRFADTMKMSTYLLAFVVGELEATEPVDVDGVPLRIVHVPGKGHLTGYPLEISAFALRFFADYYAIPYPGDKLDLVALPDFAAGAMENVGCVTFRETLLLAEPTTASQKELEGIADTVTHEIAHMWFGDLVTMRWWNGLWLNEAFATFMEFLCVDAFRPDWQRWVSFGVSRTAGLDVDALHSTRPIEYPVHSPADARGMFDTLTYLKGGALLRMLQTYLGEEAFRDGVRHYLATHAYSNTETSDLWDAIEAVTGEPARRTMDSWIFQGGFPLVSAELAGSTLELSQQRFVFDGAAGKARWVVPLLVREGGPPAPSTRVLLNGESTSLQLTRPDSAVVVNAGGNAFVRVRYDRELLGRLTGAALDSLTALERYALIDDTWAAVVAGRVPAAEFVRAAGRFTREKDPNVWRAITTGLTWCDRILDGEPRARLQAAVRDLARPAFAGVGFRPGPGESGPELELRGLLIELLGVAGRDEEVRREARRTYERSTRDPASVDATVAAAAARVVAVEGTDADQDRFFELAEDSPTPQLQERFLYGLADFPKAEQMDRTLAYVESGARNQDGPLLLLRCIRNRDLGGKAWAFFRDRWDEFSPRYPGGMMVFPVMALATLTEPEQVEDARAFFETHDVPEASKTVRQVLERQAINAAMRARETSPLADALS